MLSPSHKCNGNEAATFIVDSMQLRGPKIQILTNESIYRADIVKEWKLSFNQFDITHKNLSLHRRNLWSDYSAHQNITTNNTHSHISRFDLTTNYNSTTNSAEKDRLIMFETMQASAYCDNCFSTGEIDVIFELSGKGSLISMYNLTITGNIRGNIDLMVVLLEEYEAWPLYTIFEKGLTAVPVAIPGVVIIKVISRST